MGKSRKLSVSDIAFYADNPNAYCETRGSAENAKAAQYGVKHHEEFEELYATKKAIGSKILTLILYCLATGISIWIITHI